jgi:hypothetical protein
VPARRGFKLPHAQNVLENEMLSMHNHYIRVPPKKVICPLDSSLRQRMTGALIN